MFDDPDLEILNLYVIFENELHRGTEMFRASSFKFFPVLFTDRGSLGNTLLVNV